MKLSEKQSRILALVLVYAVPLLLLVPNVLLGIFGQMPFLMILANTLLPAGLLLVFMTIYGRVGLNTLLLLPFMMMAAFQIVLLFLYSDGSIIGVDMFLNVVTTNTGEAGELLSNLKTAIALVGAIYLPPIIAATIAICFKSRPVAAAKRLARWIGCGISVCGLIILIVCKSLYADYQINEKLYPYNVMFNLGIAVKRTYDTSHYHQTASAYTYGAKSIRPADEREVYVAVIGETSRAANWQLYGYQRRTNPQLSMVPRDSISVFSCALSESNTTHKAVPLLMTSLDIDGFDSDINYTKSVITAFNEAGFHTAYVTMQGHNGSYIDFFGEEADETYYMREPVAGQPFRGEFDTDMLEALDSLLAREYTKQLIVLHQYGSHFNYMNRYPRRDSYFLPDKATDATVENRESLINAYDNTIRHTDELLAGVISRLDSLGCNSAMIYTSDHGEDIFDDSRKRFLHSSPTPTFYQLHVPMLVYLNGPMRSAYPGLHLCAKEHEDLAVCTTQSYTPTLLQLAGIVTPKVDESESLTSSEFVPVGERRFLSDRNQALSLERAGFRREDFRLLRQLNERTWKK